MYRIYSLRQNIRSNGGCRRLKLIVFSAAIISVALFSEIKSSAQISIIPKPQSMVVGNGSYVLDRSTFIKAPPGKRANEIAAYLRDAIRLQTGITTAKSGRDHLIEFVWDRSIANEEGYRLEITPSKVSIRASDGSGFFWAVQTLRQLIPTDRKPDVEIPVLTIDDAPALKYRGHMLDVGRHFFPLEFIKKQIDLLSFYKINTFRWHLTEDQGWRIAIKKYPRLTAVGAWRREPDGSRYGGFYTQNQIRELVEYARIRNVTVIPEIEMPGHATAALAAYPEFSCRMKPLKVSSAWGVHKDVFCAGNDETFEFIENVLDEVIKLFPSQYIHIGGDEVPKDRWCECPKCQARIRKEGLKDENGLQAYFIRRIQRYLSARGKSLIGWDEILEGGADKDSIIEVWRGDVEARKAINNGNRVIIAGPFYFDASPQNRKLKDVYDTQLFSSIDDPQQKDQVLGAECPLWTEQVTPLIAESMLYPRLQAFAEVVWLNTNLDLADFKDRMAAHYRYMDAMGYNYGPEDKALADYQIAFDTVKQVWRLTAAAGIDGVGFRYTFNGPEPSINSAKFDNTLEIAHPTVLRVAPFRHGRRYGLSRQFNLVANKALGKQIKFAAPIDKHYDKAGEMALTDGISGSTDYNDGIWAGWQGVDLDAVLDLGKRTSFNTIAANFLQQSGSWIIQPSTVTFYVSNDGKDWTELKATRTNADPMNMDTAIRTIRFVSKRPLMARFVRLKAVQYGILPPEHNGAGGRSWIFADELIIR